MTTVLQEVTDEQLTRIDVERRVEDWAARIEELYRCIEDWLPSGWSARRGGPVAMNEQLMREYGVPPRDLPTLDIVSGSGRRGTVEPRALWIIGANGRLDLIWGDRHYLIIDTAENFETPNWRVAQLHDRTLHVPFDRDWFQNVIAG